MQGGRLEGEKETWAAACLSEQDVGAAAYLSPPRVASAAGTPHTLLSATHTSTTGAHTFSAESCAQAHAPGSSPGASLHAQVRPAEDVVAPHKDGACVDHDEWHEHFVQASECSDVHSRQSCADLRQDHSLGSCVDLHHAASTCKVAAHAAVSTGHAVNNIIESATRQQQQQGLQDAEKEKKEKETREMRRQVTDLRSQLAQYKEAAKRLQHENAHLTHQRLVAVPKVSVPTPLPRFNELKQTCIFEQKNRRWLMEIHISCAIFR